MKTIKNLTLILSLVFIAISFPNCNGGDTPEDTYVPDLSTPPNSWQNVNDASEVFFFFSVVTTAGSGIGTFEGNRNNGTSEHFTGSYNHSSITMVFDGSPTRTYTGSFNASTNPITMTLTTPAAGVDPAISFTLKKL